MDDARNWVDTWRASIRAGGHEAIAQEHPVRPTELRHKTALTVPAAGGAITDAAIASMHAKNAEIAAVNDARDAQSAVHVPCP